MDVTGKPSHRFRFPSARQRLPLSRQALAETVQATLHTSGHLQQSQKKSNRMKTQKGLQKFVQL
jgi:hypothetical protein